MDEDKIIRKISLEFFDVPYEELNTSEQLIVRNELKKELKRIREPIPRPPSYAGGGMMNMDEMTRPLGYAAGGPIPRNEFDALMAEFDTPENRAGPGEPTGIEKIIADKYPVDPRHTLPANFPVDDKFLTREIGGDIGRDELEGLLKYSN